MNELLTYLPELLHGVVVTIILLSSSMVIGLLLAITMTTILYFENKLLCFVVHTIIFFIRGTPLLVQLFLIYYGLGQFEWVRHSFLWILLKEPTACAIIALSINTACYTTILLIGAVRSVPKNEIMACEALGMSKWLTFRHIIFPQAFSMAMPAYSNEMVIILKSTSLASTITLLDVMGVTQKLIAQTYDTINLYLVAGVIYLCLNALLMNIWRWGRKILVLQTNH